jgi:hypothetical protein
VRGMKKTLAALLLLGLPACAPPIPLYQGTQTTPPTVAPNSTVWMSRTRSTTRSDTTHVIVCRSDRSPTCWRIFVPGLEDTDQLAPWFRGDPPYGQEGPSAGGDVAPNAPPATVEPALAPGPDTP